MTKPDLVKQFVEAFEEKYDASQWGNTATDKWVALRDTIHHTVFVIYGKKTTKSHDQFKAKSPSEAYSTDKQSATERNLQILRDGKSKVQHTARRYVNEYWTQLSKSIQMATATSDLRGMYDGIKTMLGLTQSKTASLKSSTVEVFTD